MITSFSPVPLVGRVLELAEVDAENHGHSLGIFDQISVEGEIQCRAHCLRCGATLEVVCSAFRYTRSGTALERACAGKLLQ